MVFRMTKIKVPLRITKFISAFPGTGKTHAYKVLQEQGIKVADSDSSHFDKAKFPQNYIEHLKSLRGKMDVVLISSHDTVRKALLEAEFNFTLVYPDISLKAEYMVRYRERGSPQAFLDLMDKNWDQFIVSCRQQQDCIHVVLEQGQYLSDILELDS